MAIVVFLFYPESAGKTLEEMDFLFTKGRSIWTFKDREAIKVGALVDRDLAHGEALTTFDDDSSIFRAKASQARNGSMDPGHVESAVRHEKEAEDR